MEPPGFFDDIGAFIGGVSNFAGGALHDIAGIAGHLGTIGGAVNQLSPNNPVVGGAWFSPPYTMPQLPPAITPPALTVNNGQNQTSPHPGDTSMLLWLAVGAIVLYFVVKRG